MKSCSTLRHGLLQERRLARETRGRRRWVLPRKHIGAPSTENERDGREKKIPRPFIDDIFPLQLSMSKLLDSTRPVLDPRAKVPPDLFQPTPPSEATGAAAAASGSSSRARPRPVALHGNYLNYYERRHGDPDARDERLALVPRAWTDGRSVLDVGANAGAISIELASTRDPRTVTGVDIDPDLTRKAKRNLDEAWSRLAPSRRLVDEANRLSSLTRKRRRVAASPSPVSADVVPGSASAAAADPLYFPASLGRMFGYLPPPRGLLSDHHLSTTEATRRGGRGAKRTKKVTLSSEVKRFPENVRWSTADWVHEEIDSDREGYDLILA